MFGILLIDILFFAIPIIIFAFLGISIYRYASAVRKNAKIPDSFSQSEITKRKIILIVSAIIAGVFLAVVVGFIVLIYLAVAYM